MKINHIIHSAYIISLALFISSCASSTKQMVLSPEVNQQKNTHYIQKSASVSVNDLRSNTHIIAISKEGEPTELISANSHIDQAIKKTYRESLKHNQLTISENAENKIQLIINQAEINVNQALVKYSSSTKITLTAQVSSNDKTLTKTFNTKGSSEGVLTADIAVLERDFNQQLSKLITQIVNDPEIYQFIQ